jgi:DNA-binding MarR family transcriptional regulator
METQDRIAIVQQFGRTYRAFMAAFEASVGQPMPRWRVLMALYDPISPTQSQKRLVERLTIDPGALTRQLKQLEALGWIERSTDARDNRLTNVVLTAQGRVVIEQSLPRRHAFLASSLAGVPDHELNAMQHALKTMEDSVTRIGAAASAARAADPERSS